MPCSRAKGEETTVLVNNAGITRDGALMLMDPTDWQDVIDANLTGVFNFCRAAAIHFFRRRGGSIINMRLRFGDSRERRAGQLLGLEGGHHRADEGTGQGVVAAGCSGERRGAGSRRDRHDP